MKKKYLTGMLLLIVFNPIFCQSDKIYVDKIVTNNKIIHGVFENKEKITISLEYVNNSGAHDYIYSVKGWYNYHNNKTPLVGIYDNGYLALYRFHTQEQKDTVLEFKTVKFINFWNEINELENIASYDEKITIEGKSGTWTDGQVEKKFDVSNSDINIVNEVEYLKMNIDGKYYQFNLREIGEEKDRNFKLVSFKKGTIGYRVLLSFNYLANPYALGVCGAGEVIGFVQLDFDNNLSLTNYDRVLIESCYEYITYDEVKNGNPGLKSYEVSYMGSDSVEKKIIAIDLGQSKIVRNPLIVSKNENNDLEEMGLNGAVKSIRNRTYSIKKGANGKEEKIYSSWQNFYYTFNYSGNYIEQINYDETNKLDYRKKYFYDEEGRLIKREFNNSTSAIYKYDDHGRLIEERSTEYDYLDLRTTYKYDDQGYKISCVVSYDESDPLETFNYKYNDDGKLIFEKGKTPYNYNFPITEEDAYEYFQKSYGYDDKGCLKLIVETYPVLKIPASSITSYVYNSKWNKVQEKKVFGLFNGEISFGRTKYKYDEKGNLIEEDYKISFNSRRNKNIKYLKYDDMGNWIKKIIIEDNPPDTSYVERIIEYY